jgi:hypothetical protein
MSTSKSSSRKEVKSNAELNVTSPELDGIAPATRSDGTPIVGDETGGRIKVDYATRVPHPGERKHRRRAFPLLVEVEMRRRAERNGEPEPTDEDVAIEINRRLDEAAKRRINIEGALDEIAPESEAPDAHEVDRLVEEAAIMRLPVMVWAWLRLLTYTSGPKVMPMWRRLAGATCMRMALASRRPCAKRLLEEFCKENRFLAWAYRWPGCPPADRPEQGPWELSAFHKQIKKVLGPANPFEMWAHVNRAMLLELLGEHRTHKTSGGRFANCAHALTYIAVDGFLIEADLPQEKPKSEALARMIRKEARKRCGYVQYTDSKGSVKKKCHGYKWMQLSLPKLGGLVLHGALFPANVDERKATMILIKEVFRLWPELKDQKEIFLIGDALYDQSEQFAYELTFRWGIHPVFPRAGSISSEHELAETEGVPKCHCGRWAAIKHAPDFPTPWRRKTKKLPEPGKWVTDRRGEVIDNARIRWECPKPDGKKCRFSRDTYPRQNPRLYTYLPRNGDHSRAALRVALLSYRNTVESSFSVLKDMGLSGKSQDRPKWAGDDQMDHLIWMTVVAMTGRRLVHSNGLYEQVRDEATDLGLLTASMPTTSLPALLTEAEWKAAEEALKTYAKAPAGWPEIGEQTNSDSHEVHRLRIE